MKITKKLSLLLLSLSILLSGQLILLQNSVQAGSWSLSEQEGFGSGSKIASEFGETGGSSATDIRIIIARVIKILLGFIGTIFFLLIFFAGYKYMTAQGNEEQVTEALTQIKHSVIGLLIILSAWMITEYTTECILDLTAESSTWMCSN